MVSVVVPEEFVVGFNGSLVGPDDVRYDEVRAVHNGLVDKRPGLWTHTMRCRRRPLGGSGRHGGHHAVGAGHHRRA
jgi:hypothetical protein